MKQIKHHLPVVHLVFLTLLLYLAQPLARAQNIYYTGFENVTPTNWQGWSSDNGVWAIGSPTTGPGAAYDGTQCAYTTGPGGDYLPNVSSRLISPPINLPTITSGKQQITLTFWQWFLWGSGFFGASTGDVQVSTWNGTAWTAWATVSNPPYSGSSGGIWDQASVDLSAYAGQIIQIGFQHNGNQYTGPGWYIDDVEVNVPLPTPVLSSISPSSANAGCPCFTLTVKGSKFATGDVIDWNGNPLTTTFVSGTALKAWVPASDIANPGTAHITVINPSGASSNSKTFTILVTTLKLGSASLSKNSDGSYTANLTINNVGYNTAPNVTIAKATLGSAASSTTLPQSLGSLAAGASANASLNFPASAGSSGQKVTLKVSGKFTGGSFSGSLKVTLP